MPLSRLLMLNRPEWSWGAMGVLGSSVAALVNPAFAFVIAAMIKTFYVNSPSQIKSEASFYCWMFFVIAVGSLIALTFQQVGCTGRWRVAGGGWMVLEAGWWLDGACCLMPRVCGWFAIAFGSLIALTFQRVGRGGCLAGWLMAGMCDVCADVDICCTTKGHVLSGWQHACCAPQQHS